MTWVGWALIAVWSTAAATLDYNGWSLALLIPSTIGFAFLVAEIEMRLRRRRQ